MRVPRLAQGAVKALEASLRAATASTVRGRRTQSAADAVPVATDDALDEEALLSFVTRFDETLGAATADDTIAGTLGTVSTSDELRTLAATLGGATLGATGRDEDDGAEQGRQPVGSGHWRAGPICLGVTLTVNQSE